MLSSLSVRHFALIEALDLAFDQGLLVITGETGSGKSILLEALEVACGGRIGKEMIRRGEQQASVTATFLLEYPITLDVLKDAPTIPEKSPITLRREWSRSGKSSASINGESVRVGTLKDFAQRLISFQSQSEQITLFDPDQQAFFLDQFIGAPLEELISRWQVLRNQRIQGLRALKKVGLTPQQRQERLDELDRKIQLIDQANFQPGEVEECKEKLRLLSAMDRIREEGAQALYLLENTEEISVSSQLDAVSTMMKYASNHSNQMDQIRNQVIDLSHQCSQLASLLQEELQNLEMSPGEQEKLENRLSIWNRYVSEFGSTEEDWEQSRAGFEEERQALIAGEGDFESLRQELKENERQAESLALLIHSKRVSAAVDLSKRMTQQIQELNMPQAQFYIAVTPIQSGQPGFWSERGRDEISFTVSTNQGEALMPLGLVASGGELSRILLAVKSLLAEADETPVLVFDEIDSGLSGDTTSQVTKLLKKLSQSRQLLVVSHSPQIAAQADQQYWVYKVTTEDRTQTQIEALSPERREKILATLLSGSSSDPAALELARSLLQSEP